MTGYENLAFSGNDLLLASFRTPEGKSYSPWRVTVVLLDAARGTVLATKEWSTRERELGLFSTRAGKFIVRTDERPPDAPLRPKREIVLYSPKLEALKVISLQSSAPEEYEIWRAYVTPTRRSIVLEHGLGTGSEFQWLDPARGIEVQWLDPDTLQPKANWAWTGPQTPFPSDTGLHFSDGSIVATIRNRAKLSTGEKASCEIYVRSIDGPWKPLFRSEDFRCSIAQFVNEDTVVLSVGEKVHLLRIDGRALTDQRLGKDEFAHEVRPSANGRRFAIAVATLKGGNALLDISSHEVLKRIMVFDLSTNSWVYSMDSKTMDLKYVSGFALSPDGLRLAVMSNGFVELYGLPD